LEWATVHGVHRYGTPRAPVVQAIAHGRPALLEIDLQGARQVRSSWPEAQFVFLAPPSWQELVRRLAGRGTESVAQQERRLQTARAEMAAQSEFDHVVVNGEIGQAVKDLVALVCL
jgi:guanylate kinase